MKKSALSVFNLIVLSSMSFAQPCAVSIASKFNATPITTGSFIWFSSQLKASGVTSAPVTITFTSQTITSSGFSISVPDATVTINPSATASTAFYNGTSWVNEVPLSSAGDAFLAGFSYQVPADLPGLIDPVTWTGSFTISDPAVKVKWKWAAAVYSTFSTDLNTLGVKPSDSKTNSGYLNSDPVGTPENFKSYAIAGATGGGVKNYTGGNSSSGSFICPVAKMEDSETIQIGSESSSFSAILLKNPSESFTIRFANAGMENVGVKIIDLTGRLVEEKTENASGGEINLGNNLLTGTYTIQVTDGVKLFSFRGVKL